MGTQIDKNTLLKAMKDYVYVTTQSGPIVPSKTKVIKMLTKQIPDPVKKPQDGEDWDHRTYDQNKPLVYGKNLITTRDLYKKVFTEAVTNTAYRGMRMNLASIDMKETHCKFIINRRDHDMLVELFYPNENENISVKLTSDTGLSNLYEVSLQSPQFVNNFGYTILKTCDELIDSNNTYDVGNDLDTMQTLNGLGNGSEDASNSWMATDSSIYHECVDSGLAQLLNMCNAVTLLEDGEQAPGAEAFAMDGEEQDIAPPENIPGMENNAIGAGDVNGSDDDKNALVDMKSAIFDNMSSVSHQALDTLGKILSQKMSQDAKEGGQTGRGFSLSPSEIYNGTKPMKNEDPKDVFNAFFKEFQELERNQVPEEKIQEFLDYLDDPQTADVSLTEFNDKLTEIFPDAMNAPTASPSDMSTSDLSLPGETAFGGGAASTDGFDLDAPVDPSAMDASNDFMNDGSFGAMMDQVGGEQVDLPPEGEDFAFGTEEDELGADVGPSQQPADKTKESAASLTNIG